ncbi:MAG: biopolymer transporter Tol [Devosia sp.]
MTQPSVSQFTRRGRTLLPGQISQLITIGSDGSNRRVLFEADEIIEAPNWTPDGRYLIVNAGGELWRFNAYGGDSPQRIDTGALRGLNNDHVLSPDGALVYVSDDDGHLYVVPIGGGPPRRVSNVHATPHHYYLHGISPDGVTLSYVAVEGEADHKRINMFTIPAAGGPDTRLSDVSYPNDGPEYSPDGQWIYFSSERDATQPGHAQCYRMRADGSGIEQLTHDERVNWFPHVSPDGQSVVFISFPPETLGHPPNKDVILRFMRPDGSGQSDIISFLGGQGTINVNSWAPDSTRFAYVAYPMREGA